ncbi:signal peptidase I [Hazenella coriacea]|nr:signal peptidase I [Hazenella coriacea]
MNRTLVKFVCGIGVLVISYLIFIQFFGFVKVVGSSMSPNLDDGEIVVMKKAQGVERGEIIFFRSENYNYIKRVIGLPGDRLDLKGGRVYLNGSLLEERYLGQLDQIEIESIHVPKDHLFVLGDDRLNSIDSRHFGFIPIKNVEGIILQ